MYGQWLRLQAIHNHLNSPFEIGTDTVHFVHKADTWNVEAVGLSPHSLRLWLNTRHGIKYDHSAIKHPQRALHLGREIDMSGRINNVNLMVIPEAGRGSSGDRDTTLPFLIHPIHSGGAVMNFAHAMDLLGIKKDTFSCSCLTGINMSDDTDVSYPLQRGLFGHQTVLLVHYRYLKPKATLKN